VDAEQYDGLKRAIGARIRERRAVLGLTQDELASKGDVTRSTLANVECGRSFPSIVAYIKMCEAMKVDAGPFLRSPQCEHCGDAPPAGFMCPACGAGGKTQE
jgi:transcriptional regulator with XRE-family HTH domain